MLTWDHFMSHKNEGEDKPKHLWHSFGVIKGKRETREEVKWLKCVLTVLSRAHPTSLSSLLKTPLKHPSFPQNRDFWVYIVRHLLEPGHLCDYWFWNVSWRLGEVLVCTQLKISVLSFPKKRSGTTARSFPCFSWQLVSLWFLQHQPWSL